MNVMEKFILVLFTGWVLTMAGCKKESTFQTNVFYFTGFEGESGPNFEGWSGVGYDFSNDTPPVSGFWSVEIAPQTAPAVGFIENDVRFNPGNYSLRLSCDAKREGNIGLGVLQLLKVDDGNNILEILGEVNITSDEWEAAEINAEVSIESGTKTMIRIVAGTTETALWKILVDNVKLATL